MNPFVHQSVAQAHCQADGLKTCWATGRKVYFLYFRKWGEPTVSFQDRCVHNLTHRYCGDKDFLGCGGSHFGSIQVRRWENGFFFSWVHFTLLAIPGSWEWAVDSTGIFPPRSVSFLRALCVLRVCCCLISLAWASWLLRWPCLAHSCCSLVQQVNSPRVLASQTRLCLAPSLSLPCYTSQTLIPNLCSRLRRNFPKKGRFDPSKCNENREVGSQDYLSLLKIYLTFLHITLKGDIVGDCVHVMSRVTLKSEFPSHPQPLVSSLHRQPLLLGFIFHLFFQKHYLHIKHTYMYASLQVYTY